MNKLSISETDTARKILDSARAEFAGSGFHGARVDRIASRAGVNKAMLYYHFGNKEKLYQAVIDEHLSQISIFLDQTMTSAVEPEELLRRIVAFYDGMFATRGEFLPIFLREAASGGERIKEAFRRAISERGLTRRLREILENGQAAGLLRNVDSTHAIVSFIGMNLFYLLMAPIINAVWEIKDEEAFRKQRRDEVVDLFLHGLKAR